MQTQICYDGLPFNRIALFRMNHNGQWEQRHISQGSEESQAQNKTGKLSKGIENTMCKMMTYFREDDVSEVKKTTEQPWLASGRTSSASYLIPP